MAACRSQALQLWLLAVVAIGATAQVVLVPDDAAVHTLDEHDGPELAGAHPLPDLGEGVGEGTGVMTEAMVTQAQKHLVRLANGFKSESLQMQGFGLQRLANKVFLQEGSGSQSSGLDLIFRKLDELEKKVNGEEEAEAEVENANLDKCKEEITRMNDAISTASSTRKANQQEIRQSSATIEKNRESWKQSRAVEMDTHESIIGMQAERRDASEAIAARVDERNKAIDVMVKATFMVCERFGRYKNTAQCIEIKSEPDVDEPQRYATKEAAKAEKESEAFHAKGSVWDEKWKAQMEKDIKLEGKPDPEGLLAGAQDEDEAAAPAPAPAPAAAPAPAPAPALLETALIELESSGGSKALSKQQVQAVAQLEQLAQTEGLKSKYALPITELALALKSGAAKRSKSIVQILQEVLKETREEQAKDKAQHDVYLGECYKQSWDWKAIVNEHTQKQADLRANMESLRLRIIELNQDNEVNRNVQNDNQAARSKEEDRCWAQSEAYGVRAGLRAEDLENLVKLKSILRSLYFKQFPKACARHTNKVMCANSDQGMCVFTDRKKEVMEQRCSCNVGFYGKACELVMCPGVAKNLYRADAQGVCSNRGSCDTTSGLCTCRAEYFHGPKRACDYKYSPPSKGDDCSPHCDNQCSNKGKFDPIRGECTCNHGYFGPGCEQMKCPNSNGVLYPMSSGNSCNGRGPCNPDTGKCGCPVVKESEGVLSGNECHDREKCGNPYFGESCEFERCPNDCMGRGTCNHQNGRCNCENDEAGNPFYGPSCEFRSCPMDCNGGGSGECNRNDGKCICKDGYSGEACVKTSRCEAPTLHNDAMNWWTIWDKPGWMVCPKGQLMYSLKRGLCQALSCINSGGCAAPCEGPKHVFQLRHCYHDLRWYSSFDRKGVSKCLNDYFVAGLFRSCESLYCLNMAKCCSLNEARWTQCSWSNWDLFNGPGTGRVEDHKFIVGFKRDEGHQLKDLDEAMGCNFVRGY